LSTLRTVLYLGSNGFPYGMAAIQRQLQIAKAIKNTSTRVIVLNRKGVHTPETIRNENIRSSGMFEGIEYRYTSGNPKYFTNFLLRNVFKVIGLTGELFYIVYFRIVHHVPSVVVNTTSILQLKYYYFLTRFLRIKLVYDYVEYMSSLEDRTIKIASANKSFDTEFIHYADSLIVISYFLADHVKQVAPDLPFIIIPPIIDFEKFEKTYRKPLEKNYLLYCGSTQYFDVIEFIIGAYQLSRAPREEVLLILIVNGDDSKIKTLQEKSKNLPHVIIKSGLSYSDLIGYYKSARALLIPLQDNLQDKARFPFKISEYTAAARPIITSNFGAVSHYFQHQENALLSIPGDQTDFAANLNFLFDNPEAAEQIALEGYKKGLQYFNYKGYSAALANAITN